MKRKFAIISMILLVSAVSVFAVTSASKFEGEDEIRTFGEARKGSIEKLVANDNQSKSDAVCIIEGEYISKEYFEVRYNSYKNSPLNYENPEEKTLQSLKREMVYKRFADEHGLTPTQAEIKVYVQNTRSSIEELEEGRALIENYAQGLGMTEDEYWEYNEKYEAPLAVTWIKVDEYIAANNLDPLEYADADVTVLEKEYFEKLK